MCEPFEAGHNDRSRNKLGNRVSNGQMCIVNTRDNDEHNDSVI